MRPLAALETNLIKVWLIKMSIKTAKIANCVQITFLKMYFDIMCTNTNQLKIPKNVCA